MTPEPNAVAVSLTLYVVGGLPGSVELAAKVRATLVANLPDGSWRLDVVDVIARPELALQDEVFATPTLVRKRPLPVVKLLGDLSRSSDVVSLLGFDAADSPTQPR
jgi:hypothetical protein